MKTASVLFLLMALVLLTGCGPRESQVRIRSLTADDCRLLVRKVIPLCATKSPKRKGSAADSESWLRGDDIPEALAYLKPRRVYLTDSSATIELWRGAGGDDTIYVICDDDGVWQVSVHEGDLLTKDRLIWTSR